MRSARCKLSFLTFFLDLLVTLKAIHGLPGAHRPHGLIDSSCTKAIVNFNQKNSGRQKQGCQSCARRSAPQCLPASDLWAVFAEVKLTNVPVRELYEAAYALP